MNNASFYPYEVQCHILGEASTGNETTEDMLSAVAYHGYILSRDMCSLDVPECHYMDFQPPNAWGWGEVPYQYNMAAALWRSGHDYTDYMKGGRELGDEPAFYSRP